MEQHLKIIAERIKEVEAWAEENRGSYWFDDFVWNIQYRLREIEQYAALNNVPILVNARSIAEKHYNDAEGYSEEESSSSYYEEESSSYYEEEEEESSEW